jgi:hypothetical protein
VFLKWVLEVLGREQEIVNKPAGVSLGMRALRTTGRSRGRIKCSEERRDIVDGVLCGGVELFGVGWILQTRYEPPFIYTNFSSIPL